MFGVGVGTLRSKGVLNEAILEELKAKAIKVGP
jgi:hypothetical protein